MHIVGLSKNISSKIFLSGSKSISNRLLVLNALFKNKIKLKNLSEAKDTQILRNILLNPDQEKIDVGHAGTTMRFLTSYFSYYSNKERILTGSNRMKERPIGILVDALCSMGILIKYIENKGFPPLKISPSQFRTNKVRLFADTSSQFITSLLLIGAKLPFGLELELLGKITSFPYLEMTFFILNELGIDIKKNKNKIIVKAIKEIEEKNITIESDWSSASYYYSIAAISESCNLEISYLFEESIQADSKVSLIYKDFFGIHTEFSFGKVFIRKINNFNYPRFINLNLNDCPDIAQTIAVTASALKIPILLSGLETLKIKETDRLIALHKELTKCGVQSIITDSTFEIKSFSETFSSPKIETYQDHRMAMAFTPLALLYPIDIFNEMVVEKSYPNFWNDMNKLGIKKLN